MRPHTPGNEPGLAEPAHASEGGTPAAWKRFSLAALLPGREAVKCRHCGSTDVRPSHKATSKSEYVVYRCRSCKHHFKVVSAKPRSQAMVSIVLFLLVVAGVGVSLFMSADPVAEHPRFDTQDSRALAKTEAAAKKGNVQAQYDLGWSYWQRDDYAKALPLLRSAAERGHIEAKYLLGLAYLNGRGTVQNYRAALEQFTQAADHGHLEAQFQLGIFHRDGLATPPDREAAYMWLNIAAARGHAEALAMRERLTMIMKGEEIMRAQEASTETHKRLAGKAPAKP